MTAQYDPRCYAQAGVPAALGTGPVRTVFNFYARLFDPRKQLCLKCPTYAQIRFANDTICLGEAMRFARDFRVLPQLLTRGDIQCVANGGVAVPVRVAV